MSYTKQILTHLYRLKAASVTQSDSCPISDQEVACSIPAGSGNIFS